MDRTTYFDGSRWRLMIGGEEYSGPTVDRLAAYEDTGLEPDEIMARIVPDNEPLTLEELREMDGEPVYIVNQDPQYTHWYIWDNRAPSVAHDGTEGYGLWWLAYRRRPDEGTT